MAVNLSAPTRLPPVAGVHLASVRAIKSRHRDDLAVIALSAGSAVSAVFTRNRFAGPPVVVCREHLAAGFGVRALAINAGIANAGTLPDGLDDAKESCRLAAAAIDCEPMQVLPFSTGVIMQRLPMGRYADGIKRCARGLKEDNWLAVAKAIMTTDTVAKGAHRRIGDKTVTGIAKGSGMIHPNMATMLAFVATDAAVSPAVLHRWQKRIAADSFNAISVDGDTSTNDSFVLIATGKTGAPASEAEMRALKRAIAETCAELAEAIIRDGEGATKLLEIRVSGGKTRAICRRVADAIARSPLVKTALAAGDANVGRWLMAIGNAGEGFDPAALRVSVGEVPVIANSGMDPRYNEEQATAKLAANKVVLHVSIGNGGSAATVKTCDLTHGYIDINANYRS